MAQADDRYQSEAVLDGLTLSQVYAAATPVNGSPPMPSWSSGTWSQVNGPMLGWLSSLSIRLREYVLQDSFFAPAEQRWPDARTSNYEVACSTADYSPTRSKVFMRPIDVPSIGLDYQSPVLYPASSSAYGEVGTQLSDHLSMLSTRE